MLPFFFGDFMDRSGTKNKNSEETKDNEIEVVIITGLSGSGISTAIKVFEDMNFFTTDGIPASIAPELINLAYKPDMQHFRGIVLGIDLKRKYLVDPLAELLPVLTKNRRQNRKTSLIYLEADDDSIIKRYASTRRPHPLEQEGYSLEAALTEEKNRLKEARSIADHIINTTDFSIHDLRRYIQKLFSKTVENSPSMWVTIMSFGYKYGIPKDADLVFDMRCLPNPYFVPELREYTGLQQKIVDYIFKDEPAQIFRKKLLDFLLATLPAYDREGRYRLCIAIGCTGGYHRSVAMVEYLAKNLMQNGYKIIKEHKQLPNK